tara:strand:- start:253 stop:600 length:348 start_codon:yes stop_codon:yes gene_type:complete
MTGGLVGKVTVASITALEPLPLRVMVGAVVYPDPPALMLTDATGPVVSRTAVAVPALPPPDKKVVGIVTAGTDVYPLPALVLVTAVRLLVVAWLVSITDVNVALPLAGVALGALV